MRRRLVRAAVRTAELLPTRLIAAFKEKVDAIGRLDYGRAPIHLRLDSLAEHGRLWSCRKEPETIAWIETHVRPGDVVYDIGANVGAYSLVIDRFTDGRAKVFAFEPSFATFTQLSRNIFLNQCAGRVIPLHVALGETTSLANFNYTSLSAGTSLHTLGPAIDHREKAFTPVFVQPILGFRLDDLVETFKLDPPTCIKLDVDGVELGILRGAPRTLAHPALRTLIVEVEADLPSSEAIVALLADAGFRCDARHRHEGQIGTANYVFTREPAAAL